MTSRDLPADLVRFLLSGHELRYDPSECEAGSVGLVPLDQLAIQLFPVDVQSSAIEVDDPHRGELGCYMVPAVNLTNRADGGYDPVGLLLWLPVERRFATWDSSHPFISVFDPEVTWTDIAGNPPRFINAQWEGAFDDSAPTRPLVPWPRHSYRTDQVYEPQTETES